MAEDSQEKALECTAQAVEPEIVSPGGDRGPSSGPRPRVFVKVYRPGPLGGLLTAVGGLLLLAAVFSFGFIALVVGAVVGLVWLLLSPLLRLFSVRK